MNQQISHNVLQLRDLPVLLVDCQSTGATPANGRVLEIGWAQSDYSRKNGLHRDGITTYVVKASEDDGVPKRILSITGIRAEEVEGGHSERAAWEEMFTLARSIARSIRKQKCPVVIHYARFESAFLNHLHEKYASIRSFPFDLICTHQIARRLFSDLPRRGIRAVAGFLGYSVGEKRRSYDHVLATAFIWKKLISQLKREYGIATLEQLKKFLNQNPQARTSARSYPMDSEIRRTLPDRPGVYRMLRSNSDVLYVGKATSLKKRVNSYFRKNARHPEHILEMLSQAMNLDVTETGSALEAAVLESDEIKRLSPPYNRSLRRREREIVFASGDFHRMHGMPDPEHRIGPFTSQEPVKCLAALRELCSNESDTTAIDEELINTAVSIPLDYRPETDIAQEGFAIFYEQHGKRLKNGYFLHALINLGRDLWLTRLAEKAEQEEAIADHEAEEEVEKERVDFVWTPEAVARTLERNILWGSFEMRRSRWFALLTESCLIWEENRDRQHSILVVFEKGHITHRSEHDEASEVPDPPGGKKKLIEKQGHFDLSTWDRMRVLNTEIRRLVKSGNPILLKIKPSITLDREKLEKLFRWI